MQGGLDRNGLRRAGFMLLVLSVAAAGFLVSRAGRLDARYAALNPVRDPATWQQVVDRTLPAEALRDHVARGSALASETLYLPPVLVLRALSLGYQSAIADLLLVRAHAYVLSHFFADRRFGWLDVYFDAITGLDPDNPRTYLWAAQVVKFSQTIDDDLIRRANAYLEQGIARSPRDPRFHMDIGFNLYFEFQGRDDAERSAARIRARDYFARAAGLPGSSIDPNFLADLFRRDREDQLAVAYALQKYYESTEEQRTQLLRRVGALSEELADGIRDEEARWKRDFPFLGISLFSLVGGRTASGLDPAVLRAVRDGPAAPRKE